MKNLDIISSAKRRKNNSNNNDKRTFTATIVERDTKISRYSHIFFPQKKREEKQLKNIQK